MTQVYAGRVLVAVAGGVVEVPQKQAPRAKGKIRSKAVRKLVVVAARVL